MTNEPTAHRGLTTGVPVQRQRRTRTATPRAGRPYRPAAAWASRSHRSRGQQPVPPPVVLSPQRVRESRQASSRTGVGTGIILYNARTTTTTIITTTPADHRYSWCSQQFTFVSRPFVVGCRCCRLCSDRSERAAAAAV